MALIDGLVSYWKFDEVSGDRVDIVNALHLVPSDVDAQYVGGVINQCFYKSTVGDNAYLRASLAGTTFQSSTTGTQSISFWMKCPEFQYTIPYKNQVGTTGTTLNMEVSTVAVGDGRLRWYTGSATGGLHSLDSTSAMTLNKWFHYILTYDSSSKEKIIYRNGINVGNATASHGNTLYTGTYLEIGRLDSLASQSKSIYVDELGVWNKILDVNEGSQLYNNGAGLTYPFYGDSALKFRS